MKTAMHELIDKFDNDELLPANWQDKFKEKTRQQIIKAYDDAFQYVVGGGFVAKTGEQYYNETYNYK